VPLRVAVFTWSSVLGKILTMDSLRKWHVIVVDWCFMCRKSRESMNHLLFLVRLLLPHRVELSCLGLHLDK
jgi:hypothetical protein